jgi:hypothetical protein
MKVYKVPHHGFWQTATITKSGIALSEHRDPLTVLTHVLLEPAFCCQHATTPEGDLKEINAFVILLLPCERIRAISRARIHRCQKADRRNHITGHAAVPHGELRSLPAPKKVLERKKLGSFSCLWEVRLSLDQFRSAAMFGESKKKEIALREYSPHRSGRMCGAAWRGPRRSKVTIDKILF